MSSFCWSGSQVSWYVQT